MILLVVLDPSGRLLGAINPCLKQLLVVLSPLLEGQLRDFNSGRVQLFDHARDVELIRSLLDDGALEAAIPRRHLLELFAIHYAINVVDHIARAKEVLASGAILVIRDRCGVTSSNAFCAIDEDLIKLARSIFLPLEPRADTTQVQCLARPRSGT